MHIRTAQLEDAVEIAEVINATEVGSLYFKGNLEKILRVVRIEIEQGGVLMAIDERDVCLGVLIYEGNGTFGKYPYLHMLSVLPEFQGRGIGKELIAYFETLVGKDHDKYFLLVAEQNKKAIKFYRRLGYIGIGVMDSFYRIGGKELLMSKEIQRSDAQPVEIKSYRKLQLKDLDLVLQMENDFRENFINRENAIQFLSSPMNWIFACIQQNRIIGFAYGYELNRMDTKGNMLYIHEVGVLPEYHQKGIGTELLMNLKAASGLNGISKLFLITQKNNIAACKLYEKTGGESQKDESDDIVYFFTDLEKTHCII